MPAAAVAHAPHPIAIPRRKRGDANDTDCWATVVGDDRRRDHLDKLGRVQLAVGNPCGSAVDECHGLPGHCFYDGGTSQVDGTTIGTVTSGSRENWTHNVGTVYLTGSTVYRGDISLIQMSSNQLSTSRIYTGDSSSSTSAAVGEMWSRSPVAGDQYCTGGSQSGEICDWTVSNAGVNFTYSTGEVLRNGVTSSTKQGWCTRPGDSGGPVYTVRSDGKVAAKGIISGGGGGGSDYYGGLLDQCSMEFTDIYQAYYGFPGTLQTS